MTLASQPASASRADAPTPAPLLSIRNLSLGFDKDGAFLPAVENVSLDLAAGETLCLVGESGSGKSITALSIARLLPTPPARYTGGEILLRGRDVLRMNAAELRRIRGGVVSYVFQEPSASLNPVMPVGRQILESLALHRPDAANDGEVIRLLQLVGIPAPESRLKDHPHQLSGGMQQRIMLAIALASQPALLIADEPTTALDVTIQAQIIELLRELKQTLGMSILLITHNLGIVGDLADHVAVMYAGQIVETGPAREILNRPLHPYTRALMNSVPQIGANTERLTAIGGAVPQPGAWPAGCAFHPRCPKAQPACAANAPELLEATVSRSVRCPLWPT